MKSSALHKQAFKQFLKETAKQSFKTTYAIEISDDHNVNLERVSDAFAENFANSSSKMYDIIEALIDDKIESAIVSHALVGSGGGVSGVIKLKSKKL